jgi:hypothetical protein
MSQSLGSQAAGIKEWQRCLHQQLEPVLSAVDSGAGLSTYTDMPFGIFLYPPEDEWQLRAELRDLVVRLENAGKSVQRLSMAKLLEQSIAAAGLSLEEIAQGEADLGIAMVRDTIRDVLEWWIGGLFTLWFLLHSAFFGSASHRAIG